MAKYRITLHYNSVSFDLDTEHPEVIEAAKEAEVDLSDPDEIADWLRNEDVETLIDENGWPDIQKVEIKAIT